MRLAARIILIFCAVIILTLCVNFLLGGFSISKHSYRFADIFRTIENTSSLHESEHVNEQDARKRNLTQCSDVPPNLVGPLAAMMEERTPETLISAYPFIKNGTFRPSDCLARERLAIIIPYRNRSRHLHIVLNNLIPVLKRQQVDVTFFVIEQEPPETFNRGALLNVGFVEARRLGRFDCFIFHDVDQIPLDDRHMYRCGDNPKHFSVAMKKHHYKMPYYEFFGGVVGFTGRQFEEMNGCSNLYFGWGLEDDDLSIRARNTWGSIIRAPLDIARYDMIHHGRDKGNEDNKNGRKIVSTAKARQYVEGLNTLRYKLNNITFHHLYTWINVALNKTEILQNAGIVL